MLSGKIRTKSHLLFSSQKKITSLVIEEVVLICNPWLWKQSLSAPKLADPTNKRMVKFKIDIIKYQMRLLETAGILDL